MIKLIASDLDGTLIGPDFRFRPRTLHALEAARAAEAAQQVADLTQREREILALIALGLTNQEICDREWLSMPTVKTHVSHLLSKTGCRDRVQLVLLALRGGVIDLADVLGRA